MIGDLLDVSRIVAEKTVPYCSLAADPTERLQINSKDKQREPMEKPSRFR
jgi:hypothetical protein